MNRSPRVILATTLAVAAGGAGLLALTARADAKKQATPQPSAVEAVQLAEVKAMRTTPTEELTGSLEPAKALQLGFEVPGRLARILVRKGAPVAEGQVIAQLDPEMADAQVAAAEAGLRAAEAQAGAAQDVAQRNAQLQQSGTVSELQGRSTASSAAAAAAGVAGAKAQLAMARASRRRHDLRAPFSGTLIAAPDQVGATVGPGLTLFTLEQLDSLVVKVTVPEQARANVRVGAKVRVESVSGGPSADDAVVRAVIPSADAQTRRVPVEVTVPNRGGRFTAHTLVRVSLPVGVEQAAQAIPATALASAGGDHVFVLAEGNTLRRVAVQVLERGAREVLVRAAESLSRVVDYPTPGLSEGTRVSVR